MSEQSKTPKPESAGVSASPPTTATPDPIIALEAECQAADAAHDAAYHAAHDGKSKPTSGELKREKAAHERWRRLITKLAVIPAVNMAGIAIKLQYVRRSVEIGSADYDADMIRTAIEAIERLPSAPEPDPAVAAARAHRRAVDHFNEMSEAGGETTMPEAFSKASDRTIKLAEVFADAIPTSPEGARQKLLDVIDCDFGTADLEDTISGRHLRTVIAYLEAVEPLAMQVSPPEPDPVLPIWDEILRLRAEAQGLSGDDDAIEAICDREMAVERRLTSTHATSLKGLHAKIDTYLHECADTTVILPDDARSDEVLLHSIWKDSARLAFGDGS